MMSGTKTAKTGVGTAVTPNQSSGAASLILTLWFVLTAVAFWGPYVVPASRLTGFASICTALYGVMVLVVVAWAALGFLRRRGATP